VVWSWQIRAASVGLAAAGGLSAAAVVSGAVAVARGPSGRALGLCSAMLAGCVLAAAVSIP